MNIPENIAQLIKAQNEHDSNAYANCFTQNAVVFDEGQNHQGKEEIRNWIVQANEKYQAMMEPIEYTESGSTSVLSAKISGSFEGSPVVLNYHFELSNKLMLSLKITG